MKERLEEEEKKEREEEEETDEHMEQFRDVIGDGVGLACGR